MPLEVDGVRPPCGVVGKDELLFGTDQLVQPIGYAMRREQDVVVIRKAHQPAIKQPVRRSG